MSVAILSNDDVLLRAFEVGILTLRDCRRVKANILDLRDRRRFNVHMLFELGILILRDCRCVKL